MLTFSTLKVEERAQLTYFGPRSPACPKKQLREHARRGIGTGSAAGAAGIEGAGAVETDQVLLVMRTRRI